jgi:hypothetical protein
MSLLTIRSAQKILLGTALYFFTCGISAIWLPVSWLWCAGLSTEVSNELHLTFGVIGAYMLALGCGSLIARSSPSSNTGLILTLVIANLFDFAVTLRAVLNKSLPLWHGIAFLIATVVLVTLLTLAWQASKEVTDLPRE